jgi:hypothetical protein
MLPLGLRRCLSPMTIAPNGRRARPIIQPSPARKAAFPDRQSRAAAGFFFARAQLRIGLRRIEQAETQ